MERSTGSNARPSTGSGNYPRDLKVHSQTQLLLNDVLTESEYGQKILSGPGVWLPC